MAIARKLLLGLVVLAVALAPAVASAATQSGKHDTAMSAASAMDHCHKAAPAKSTSSHCKHCTDDGGCTQDVCALKCFKVVADIAVAAVMRLPLAMTVLPARLHEPASWVASPPSPPPRA